jgi:hypothetical protein
MSAKAFVRLTARLQLLGWQRPISGSTFDRTGRASSVDPSAENADEHDVWSGQRPGKCGSRHTLALPTARRV